VTRLWALELGGSGSASSSGGRRASRVPSGGEAGMDVA
jgi:hypothetical protein